MAKNHIMLELGRNDSQLLIFAIPLHLFIDYSQFLCSESSLLLHFVALFYNNRCLLCVHTMILRSSTYGSEVLRAVARR